MIEIVNRKQIATCEYCDTCFAHEDSDRVKGEAKQLLDFAGEATGVWIGKDCLYVICPTCRRKVVVWEGNENFAEMQDEN